MLTQLSTVKQRLALLESDTRFDALLTAAIKAVGQRFDRQCNRALARRDGATQEFPADDTEIPLWCYPVESVTSFEVKTTEAEGWVERGGVLFLVRNQCVVSLLSPLGSRLEQARVTYAGGYVLPGTLPSPGQTPLPADLEHAAVEQVAYWFQNRERIGMARLWDYHGAYRHFADLDLLASVRAILAKHGRWAV